MTRSHSVGRSFLNRSFLTARHACSGVARVAESVLRCFRHWVVFHRRVNAFCTPWTQRPPSIQRVKPERRHRHGVGIKLRGAPFINEAKRNQYAPAVLFGFSKRLLRLHSVCVRVRERARTLNQNNQKKKEKKKSVCAH